jgi:hypothetical protein
MLFETAVAAPTMADAADIFIYTNGWSIAIADIQPL